MLAGSLEESHAMIWSSGEVQALFILGANPVYSAPGDLQFGSPIS